MDSTPSTKSIRSPLSNPPHPTKPEVGWDCPAVSQHLLGFQPTSSPCRGPKGHQKSLCWEKPFRTSGFHASHETLQPRQGQSPI